MIFFVCLLICPIVGVVVWAAFRSLGGRFPVTGGGWWMLLGFGVLTALLVFRPDEEVEAGEDAAAYFNAAQQYLRTGSLHVSDPALAELPPQDRGLFRYGDPSFMITKDHTLWAREEGMDPVSVFFFPAYSFLLGLPMALGVPYAAFWLSGLTAAAAGAVLAGWVAKLTGRGWTGWVAYGLFLAHPAVAWNLRSLRAEWPASLLVLCGLALWLPRALDKRPERMRAGLGAGLVLSVAMLFHMTAVYVVIPALVAGGMLTRRGRFWTGWWLGMAGGGLLFAAQTAWVTDPYWIVQNLTAPGRRLLLWGGLAGLAAASLLARGVYVRWGRKANVSGGIGLLMSVGLVGVVWLSILFRDEHGLLPFLPAWTVSYISLTDFQGVMRMMSRVWFAFSLLGLISLCLRSELGRWLFFLLAPASLTIGWMVNYMFETRRMVAFLVPLLILGTMSLLDWGAQVAASGLPLRPGLKARAPAVGAVLAAAVLAGVAVRGRWPLYGTWNLKGMHGFYRDISERVEPEADFLFAEYTQTAVPVEKMTGLPLLPLAWEYRSDAEVERVQEIWRDLVQEAPERRHVLLSPFQGSAVPGVAMEPLFTESVRTESMARARRKVPKEVNRWTRTLHVSRLLPPGEPAPRAPYVRGFRGSRLGARGLSSPMGARAMELRGIRLDGEGKAAVKGRGRRVLMLAYPHGHRGREPEIVGGRGEATGLGEQWQVVTVEGGEEGFEVRTERYAFLVQVFALEDGSLREVALPGEAVAFGMEGVDSQWVRAEAAFALPEHAGTSWLWVYATHGRGEEEAATLRVEDGEGDARGRAALTSEWRWHGVRLEGAEDAEGRFVWWDLITDPPFDPRQKGFPDDLGFRVHRMAVIPEASP